ncbi:MAG TPA: thioredoxin domain-containing protein [Methanothrix sp.]|nr:thioredoxin domain-containing protein [Methanothrix sp.]
MAKDPNQSKSPSALSGPANRLISETSPYLLQHAHNPVDWYPWSEEAFQAAAREDRPVFLSVGYSTCHWCHVMARESFQDPEVADLLNRTFICIKVDREERPDIDQIYMNAALAMTGRGGWPLSIIMTADKKPFFAATYIPKRGSFGQAGMMEIIPRIGELWRENRDELLRSADQILDHLKQAAVVPSPEDEALDESLLKRGYDALASIYDPQNGGFGGAPKFPAPHNLLFLLRYWKRSKDAFALQMVEETLQAMSMGGVFDHLGGGFHRYSTDAGWRIPHFEKMLYDQATMAMAYTEAYQATGKKEYARTVQEILGYVLRDMTSQQGGFFSAEDADSEGEEGAYYLWGAEELKEVLEKEDLRLLIRLFDIYESGNFETGRNILIARSTFKDAASVLGVSEGDLWRRWEGIRERLLSVREKRVHPQKDDKILADWNGLMISALAKAAQALNRPDYANAAARAADFILNEMKTEDGRLLHSYREGSAISGCLDDYAFLVWGLIDLYETLFEIKYLRAAAKLTRAMIEHFWDNGKGGLFFSPDDASDLPLREKAFRDGAIPSGNSAAMLDLLRLSHLTGQPEWENKAWQLARASGASAAGQTLGYTMLLSSLDYGLGPAIQIALVGKKEDEDAVEMLKVIRERFLPSKSVLLSQGEDTAEMAEFARGLAKIEGKSAAYVCSGKSCRPPVTSPRELMLMLGEQN